MALRKHKVYEAIDDPSLSDKGFRDFVRDEAISDRYSIYGCSVFWDQLPVSNGAGREINYYDRVYSSDILLNDHAHKDGPFIVVNVVKDTEEHGVILGLNCGAFVPASSCFPTLREASEHFIKSKKDEAQKIRYQAEQSAGSLEDLIEAVSKDLHDGKFGPPVTFIGQS